MATNFQLFLYTVDEYKRFAEHLPAVIVKIVVSKSWFFGYMFHLAWVPETLR